MTRNLLEYENSPTDSDPKSGRAYQGIILRYYRYPLPTITAAENSRFAALILPATRQFRPPPSSRRHIPPPLPHFPPPPTVIPA